jgi:hypothetical protein
VRSGAIYFSSVDGEPALLPIAALFRCIICFNIGVGLVLKQGSRSLRRISGFTTPLWRWHSAQLNPEGLSSLVDIRAFGKASSLWIQAPFASAFLSA